MVLRPSDAGERPSNPLPASQGFTHSIDNFSAFTYHLASLFGLFGARGLRAGVPSTRAFPSSCLQHGWNTGARLTSPGNIQASASTPREIQAGKAWANEQGKSGWWVGLWSLWVAPSPFEQASLIYANHMQITQKRDTTQVECQKRRWR